MASAVAAIDLDVLGRLLWNVMAHLSAAVRAPCRAIASRTPRTRSFLVAHGTETRLQGALCVLSIVVLVALHAAPLPPSLLDRHPTRWLEVLEVGLGVVVSLCLARPDASGKLWSLCSPNGHAPR